MKVKNADGLLVGYEEFDSKKTGKTYLKLKVLLGSDVYEAFAPRDYQLNGERQLLDDGAHLPCKVDARMIPSNSATGYYEPKFDRVDAKLPSSASSSTSSKS